MQAYYGFKDGSGDWFLIIDTDRCNGCGECAKVCPSDVFVIHQNDFDPLSDELVATVKEEKRKKIRYECAPCKPGYGEVPPPCVSECEPKAITHTEAWKSLYGVI